MKMKKICTLCLAIMATLTLVQCQCGTKKDANKDVTTDTTEEVAPAAETDNLQPVDGAENAEVKTEYNEVELKAMNGATAPVFTLGNETGDANLFLKYVNKQIKYPEVAREKGVEGNVVVSFLVGKDGNVTDAQILKSADALLDAEALRAVQSSPKWTPATDDKGNAIAVRYNLPVNFKLQ